MSLESVRAEWLANLSKAQGGMVLFSQTGVRGILNPNFVNHAIAMFDASRGSLLATDAAFGAMALEIGLPVVVAVGVWVALGSGYYQAREEFKNENTMTGFSHGFVTAILGWKWEHVLNRFRRSYLSINKFDEEMNNIRVDSYHKGLITGYLAGRALPADARKAYSSKIRNAGNIHGPKEWSRNDDIARNQQISYVIDMAATAQKYRLIMPY